MILTDYHVHSSISPDASSSMKEMCESAIQKGLEEIAFTDHYECLDFGKPHSIFTSSYLTNYQNTLDRCQEQFSGRLTVKRGLELGQMYLTPESSKAVLSRYPWDYVIGSVHKLHNTDLSGFTFTQDNLPVIAGEYYSGLYRLAETGDFDCLGHLDLVKRHTSRFGLPDCSDLYQPAIEAILKLLIQRGKGLELNTSGFRQEPHEGYPGTSILMLYRRLGERSLPWGQIPMPAMMWALILIWPCSASNSAASITSRLIPGVPLLYPHLILWISYASSKTGAAGQPLFLPFLPISKGPVSFACAG